MVFPAPKSLSNDLLERLPAKDRKAVVARCDEIEVTVGQEIYKQEGRIPFVYFPLDSMFSELTPSSEPPVEAFLTGREGMVGFLLALGERNLAPMHCSVQGSGKALRLKAAAFIALVGSTPKLRELAFASAYYQLQQTARNLYCVRHHQIGERLARWLLMA